MKNIRFLLALAVAGAFALSAVHAGDKEKSKDKADKAVCTMECKKDKDGNYACGKGDKCCCEVKAEKKEEKKDEKSEHKH